MPNFVPDPKTSEEKDIAARYAKVSVYVHLCVCEREYVCVCERERESSAR